MSANPKIEKEALKRAINNYKGNVSDIAQSFGCTRQTIYNHLKDDEESVSERARSLGEII